MAIFKYTLPSGSTYQMTAPDGTTPAEADKIFYEQVAAGTFVGYKKGDSISHPQETLQNFGISRLERGTAGVDDKTLLAIVNGLPVVATLPSLAAVPVTSPVTSADYLQVNTNTTSGRFSIGQTAVGPLSPVQVQTLMGQLAAIVNQPADTITQDKGVGTYGFNAQQLELAGYIKPGYADRYLPIDPSTQQNSNNFVAVMNSPSIWTGKDGVTSVNDILASDATQNQVQETLMSQSYSSLVAAGTITPPSSATPTPEASTGQVYGDNGALIAASGLALLTAGLSLSNTSSLGTAIGSIPDNITQLGGNLVASFNTGLDSLQSGAMVLVNKTKGSIQAGLDQIDGLASGNTSINTLITSNLNGDVGALITNNSKYGALATQSWAQGQNLYNNIPSSFGNITALGNSLPNLSPDMLNNLNILGKSSQFGINFSDFSISSLVTSVQPAAGFTNTVDRATVDAALTRVIGSDKIASPSFSLPDFSSLGVTADITQAKTLLSQAQTTGQAVINQGQALYAQGQSIATAATGAFNTVKGSTRLG